MSTVRYFADVPHIFRYGMSDEKNERSWKLFWRNGVQFTIHVDGKDVYGTTFYASWRPLLRETMKEDETVMDFLQNTSEAMCDLIISHSMETLQKLAPDKPYWVTLRDYLHTPSYTLKLVADTESGQIHAEVTNGPEEKPAYEFCLFPTGEFRNMSRDIARHDSSELVVLDKAENWKRPPYKIRTADGRVCLFKACQGNVKITETGEVTNTSLDAIEIYLKLSKSSQELPGSHAVRRPIVLGVVIDAHVTTPSEPASENQIRSEDTEQTSSHETGTTEGLVAGILLPVPDGQTLAKVIEQMEKNTLETVTEQSRRWKTQIEEETAQLHSLGVYGEGRPHHLNINQRTILIDADGNASLNMDEVISVDPYMNKDLKMDDCVAMDIKAIEVVFGEWLPTELANRVSKQRSQAIVDV